MKKMLLAVIALVLANILCAQVCDAAKQPAADFVLTNGKIYTVNNKQPWAESLAVVKNRIVFVGSDKDVKNYIGKTTKVINLKQKLVLPGFIDAHIHPVLASAFAGGILIKDNSSVDAVLNQVRQYVKEHPDKSAYTGFGWSNNLFPACGPTKELLDKIVPDKPVVILANDGHAGWMNSEAMKKAGITKDTPDPDPGISEFIRDKNGNPTGALKEGASMLVLGRLKLPAPQDIAEGAEILVPLISRYGITSVFDAGIPGKLAEIVFEKISEEEAKDEMPFRFFGSCFAGSDRDIPGLVDKLAELYKKYNTDKMRISTLKLVTDGTLETRKASFFKPYLDTKIAPDIVFNRDLYHKALIDAASRGFDIHLHAIGDRAIHEALEAAAAVRAAGYKDTHITICHVQIWQKEDRKRFKDTNVFVSFTGSWIFPDKTILKFVDKDTYNNQFIYKILDNDGVTITQGSDYPAAETINPFVCIEMAHTRMALAGEGSSKDILTPLEERLPLDLLVKTYTINAARQLRMDKKIGSLEKGKYADIIVLNKNIFKIKPQEIHSALPVLVMMDGKIRFNDNSLYKE